jgi:5'-3' exonuclease
MKRTLLVDADIVAFKFSSTNEDKYYFDGKDAPPAVDANFDATVADVVTYIADLQSHLKATEIIICLSDPEANFRKDIYSLYKSKRDHSTRPVYLQTVKDWFKTKYKTYQRPTLEADDCMGILSTHSTLVKGERIIVSEDKDMQTIPGLLFNPRKDTKVRKISRLDADRFHLWQAVVGDTCDGYPGAKGVGPKSPHALGVLAATSVAEMWSHVLDAHAKALKTTLDDPAVEAAALVQARCARILRATDWDFESKRPRLWSPPRLT